MAKKLYVGNLSYETTDSDLQALFAPHGMVQSAQVIMDRDTGRSKGFGFVEMNNSDEAQAAIKALNGQESNGRALTVNEARPREDRGGSQRGAPSGRGDSGGGRRCQAHRQPRHAPGPVAGGVSWLLTLSNEQSVLKGNRMTHFSVGDHVIIRFGKQQGQKATIIRSQPADAYLVKIEDGAVLFFSGRGLEKGTEGIQPVAH